jgi:hypothetical protein
MKKQMEGDNEQRRGRAADAREEGRSASEDGVTTGASNQIRTLGDEADHEERIGGSGRGKQQPDRVAAEPKPGSLPRDNRTTAQTDSFTERTGERAEPGNLDENDQRVFETLARLETDDQAPTASDIVREAGLSRDAAIPALRRLIDDHDVVQELPADPQAGNRYRVKARS